LNQNPGVQAAVSAEDKLVAACFEDRKIHCIAGCSYSLAGVQMVKMVKTKPVGISLPIDLLEKIDKLRGKIPRSVCVRDLIEEALEKR
jgi:hypothetical protein